MRKLTVLGLLSIIVSTQALQAQFYYYNSKYYESAVVFELGVTGGVMNAMTDLGGKKGIGKNFIKDLRWKTCGPSYGFYVMGMYNNVLGARIQATFGSVSGFDSILKAVASSTGGRYERNLSFKTRIAEIQLGFEVHPLFFKNYENGDPPSLSPYLAFGAGYYSFDPQANLNGQWYALHQLRTEGEGFAEYPDKKPYDLSQFNISGGLGLKYEINNTFNARLELLYRKLFTDYLDDVSTTYIDPQLFYNYLPPNLAAVAEKLHNRKYELNPTDNTQIGDQRGDPKDKDSYFTIELKIGMTFGRKRR